MTGLIPFFLVLTLSFSMPAMAKDPVITINPDGSIEVHGEMPVQPKMVPAPEGSRVEAMIDPASEAPIPARKPEAPVKKVTAVEKIAPEPIPYRDPAPAYVPPRAAVPESIPAEGITRDEAKRIALSVAPPSRSVMVYPANLDGVPVFEVIFRTYENTDYAVLVDVASGEIINPNKKKGKNRS
jgi:hypothetical protein